MLHPYNSDLSNK